MIVLVIPVAALLLALVWTRWSRHPEKPLDELAQVNAYRRTVEALDPHHDPLHPGVIDHKAGRRRMPARH
ncbi:MAG TPA: hypothetical protein VF288_03150 [Mycobacteriales bacterium]